LYSPSAKAVVKTDVPSFNFLKIDGKGDPNTSESFQTAVESLFALSYMLKFKKKSESQDLDFVVMPLEVLWWADDMDAFLTGKKDQWEWTCMIHQPDFITQTDVENAKITVTTKKGIAEVNKVRFQPFHEGKSAQILYVGPYADEAPAIREIHVFIKDNGYQRDGFHHEIYLNDPRRTAQEKLKTIIRQPMRLKD